ncbi:hypothetical protein BDZ97DRAFT_1912626 [Flammula alnicola]|nr:hypothetical protein BDZ97DRAFT_1912626 [Flammula alnicola]
MTSGKPLSLSISTPDVGEPDKNEILGAIVSGCGPSLLSRSLLGQVGVYKNKPSAATVAFNALRSKFLQLKRHARALEAENDVLKQENIAMRTDIGVLIDELQSARINYYDEINQRRKDVESAREAEDRLNVLEGKAERYEHFIKALVGISLDNPLYRAALSVMTNEETEGALVDAILEASKNKESPWARIIPAIVGPPCPVNPLSTINHPLHSKEREKASDFRRTQAGVPPENVAFVTSIASTVSGIRGEILREGCESRPGVLDNMLEALKDDKWPGGAESIPVIIPQPALQIVAKSTEDTVHILDMDLGPSPSASILSDVYETFPNERDLKREPTVFHDTAGILKNAGTALKNTKVIASPVTPQRVVRFATESENIIQAPVNESDLGHSESHSDLSDIYDDFFKEEVSTAESAILDDLLILVKHDVVESISNDVPQPLASVVPQRQAISETSELNSNLPPSALLLSEVCEDRFGETGRARKLIPSDEELFIVKPGEDIPQSAARTLMESHQVMIPTLHVEYNNLSSGSEYSDTFEEILEDEDMKEPASLEEITIGKRIDENPQLAMQLVDKVTEPASQAPSMPVDNNNFNTTPKPTEGSVEPSNSVESVSSSGTATADERSCFITPTKANAMRQLTKRFGKFPESASQVKSPPSRSVSPKSPSALLRKVLVSSPVRHIDTMVHSPKISSPRTLPVPSFKMVTPTKSIRPLAPRNAWVNSPVRKFRSEPISPKLYTRRPVQLLKPIKVTAPTTVACSRLSTPRTNTFKHPALQAIDLNIPLVNGRAKESSLKPAVHPVQPECVVKENQLKPSAKDLRKRRGVIMIERLDITPASKTGEMTTVVSTPGQLEIHDLALSLPHSDSAEDMNTQHRHNSNDGISPNEVIELNDTDDDEDRGTGIKSVDEAVEFGPTPTSARQHLKTTAPQVLPPPVISSGAELDQSLEAIKSDACRYLSRFDPEISELLASMSSSDLGSLEMATQEEDSDSDCEDLRDAQDADDIPRTLNTLPYICKALMNDASGIFSGHHDGREKEGSLSGDDLDSTPVAASSSPRRHAPTLRSATVDSSTKSRESSVSSSSSSSSSFSLDSPTYLRKGSNSPLFGFTQRPRRATNTSPTPMGKDNTVIVKLASPVAPARVPSPPTVGPTSVLAQSTIPTADRATTSTAKATHSAWPVRQKPSEEQEKKAAPLTPPRPTATFSKPVPSIQKPAVLPVQSKSCSSPRKTPSAKPWAGQSIFRRLSNTDSKPKPKPVVAQPVKQSLSHLAPSTPFSIKRRSNTISTLSPLPPKSSTPSPQALVVPSLSTKPRSNTVNTYSPINRSPLSQHVTNNSLEFQSRSNHTSVSQSTITQSSSSNKYLVPKPTPSSTIAQPTGLKSTAPLRVNKKPTGIKPQPAVCEKTGPALPTAAFMRPNVHLGSTNTRRMTNSVTPLIPNCTSIAANGVMSPTQCRHMFRNRLSMLVR